MYTDQEIVDRTYKHLIEQGSKCVNIGGACVYRGPEGKMCAIGALIPDELYQGSMDVYGNTIDEVIRHYPAVEDLFRANSPELLKRIQEIHDEYDPFDKWEQYINFEFNKLALSYRLRSPVPKKGKLR